MVRDHRDTPAGEDVLAGVGPPIPADHCRVCWREHFVVRDGELWLDHIGPLESCTHGCHDDTFMASTS